MKHINCPHCDKPTSSIRHISTCKRLHDLQDTLIHQYNTGYSLLKLSKKYKIDSHLISRFLKSKDIKVSFSKNEVNHFFFSKETPEVYWLIGLLAADGCIHNKYAWSLGQSGDDGLKLITHIKNILKHTNSVYSQLTRGNLSHRIHISSEQMIIDLKKYFITEKKTHTLKMPLIDSPDHLKSYLRGYIDGDGCVGAYKNSKGIEYLCISFVGNEEFIKTCASVLPLKPSSILKKKGVWEIRFNGQKAILFGNWLYSNNCLYKHYKYVNYYNYIKSIKETPPSWLIYNRLYYLLKDSILTENINKLSKDNNIPFQTLYHWKNNSKNIVDIDGIYCEYV